MKRMARVLLPALVLIHLTCAARADWLIPMDETQTDHLRAYGLVYRYLANTGQKGYWLLNIRGGSFLIPPSPGFENQALDWGVTVEPVDQSGIAALDRTIEQTNAMKIVLEKAPKVGVYVPPFQEMWDDAVILTLDYARIPYETFYDKEVLTDGLKRFDWVHIHHDDFTGQFGKFYKSFRSAPWYIKMVDVQTGLAKELGFSGVPGLKKAVAAKIDGFVKTGGFLFAMCGAIDTLDIALAAMDVDIVPEALDGSAPPADASKRLNFNNTLAFRNFELIMDPYQYEFSDIDVSNYANTPDREAFVLFPFSAKYDPVPAMLTQNHETVIKGFFGQTTAFNKDVLRPGTVVMGTIVKGGHAKYIYGGAGKGLFSFLGGHDPEDFSHIVGEAPTDVSLYRSSPGYRLILNNILFPAAKKQKRKT